MQAHTPFYVEVQTDPNFAGQVDEAALKTAVTATLHHQEAPAGTSVTLVITGDEQIHRLNRQFRQVDAPTDVLAFPAAGNQPFVEAPGQSLYLGDVIVSHPRAVDQATATGHAPSAELALLVVHGTLHLLGHDHAGDKEKTAMWAAQQAILTGLGLQLATTYQE